MKSTYKIKKENLKLTTLAFTLIELIAVLVILAILALIVTPLVMNIIRKARISADKRSIDAYGRSVELAIASYLLDTGTFPTDISELTIEYSGDEVACSTTQLNSDSSVYLSGCTVGGRMVDYTYGSDKTSPDPTYTVYNVGDEVSYNNVDYYVIANSDETESTLTLLKAEPLTVDEVNTYGGVGTENNRVNRYNSSSVGTAYNQNGYGGMAYHSGTTCGYVNNNWIETGCTTDYETSDIKYVLDAWASIKAPGANSVRLITLDDLFNNLGLKVSNIDTDNVSVESVENVPSWVFGTNYWYWTSAIYNGNNKKVWCVSKNGMTSGVVGSYYMDHNGYFEDYYFVVRPVITINKSLLN